MHDVFLVRWVSCVARNRFPESRAQARLDQRLGLKAQLTLSSFARALALLDQLPKFARLAQLIVFRHRQFAAEKEIAKCVLVQDAMDRDSFRAFFKINPVIFRAITMEFFSFALDHAETARVEVIEVFREESEIPRANRAATFSAAPTFPPRSIR